MSGVPELRPDGPILQALLDLLPGTLHVKDRALRYCIVNRKYLERWGGRAEDVIGRTSAEAFGDLFGTEADARNLQVFETGKPLPFYEVTYKDKRGGELVLWSTKVPITDEQGTVTHVLTFSLDITPLKRMQAELERQRQALHQSERLSVLGTLAAGISHELRNPLSVVVSQAKLLEDELTDEKARSRLSAVVRAGEHCAAVVGAYLAHSRHGPRKVEYFPLKAVIDSALALAAHVLREDRIALDAEEVDSAITVTGDPHQLSQVVLNLVLNACQAMRRSQPPRRLAIGTRVRDGQDTVEIRVADSGPGVSPELRDRIFERFFTTRAAGEGTGLGLAICRDIVTAHGGRITVEQSAFGGALFRVDLPLGRHAARAETSAELAANAASALRILVVDDEAEIAELLREILELAGHAVDVSASVEAALQQLAQAAYDAVLSDMRMPGMDGSAFYELLCSRHPGLAQRVAFITGDTLSPHVAAFFERSRVPYVTKPFVPREITALVTRLAGQGRADASHLGPQQGRPGNARE